MAWGVRTTPTHPRVSHVWDAVQVIISFGKILLQVTRPHTAVLGNIPGTNVYRNIHQYPDSVAEPGILIVRIDSSIYFANSNYIRERCVSKKSMI